MSWEDLAVRSTVIVLGLLLFGAVALVLVEYRARIPWLRRCCRKEPDAPGPVHKRNGRNPS